MIPQQETVDVAHIISEIVMTDGGTDDAFRQTLRVFVGEPHIQISGEHPQLGHVIEIRTTEGAQALIAALHLFIERHKKVPRRIQL